MGLINFLMISAKLVLSCSFWIVCRPSVALLCPLYASIRTIESDKACGYQKCLRYWVLFGMTCLLELTLAKPLSGYTFWHCVKGLASILLVLHQFGAASHAYMLFIKPYVSPNSRTAIVTEKNECVTVKYSGHIDAASALVEQDRKDDQQILVVHEVESAPACDRPIYPKNVQKNWSSVVWLVSTPSEKCLKLHIQGKKHKSKLREERNRGMKASKKPKFASTVEGCTWKKPESGWIKLNTDGSTDRKTASLGGLLRDGEGVPICACVYKTQCDDDIYLVELLAIWLGLTLALNIGIKIIWVESDSMSAVKAVNKEQPYSQKASSCLKQIWRILNKFEKYQVTHSWREANRAADYLSKMDISGSDIVIWPADFPSPLCKIIAEDAQGSWYPRKKKEKKREEVDILDGKPNS